jgi:hypothetical protein
MVMRSARRSRLHRIVAKVLRDSLMTQHAQIAPQQWFRMAQAVSTPITSMRSVGSVYCHSIAFYSRCAASGWRTTPLDFGMRIEPRHG